MIKSDKLILLTFVEYILILMIYNINLYYYIE